MANGAVDSGCTVERCSWGMCEQGLEAGESWVTPPFGLLLLVLCPELYHVLVSQRFLQTQPYFSCCMEKPNAIWSFMIPSLTPFINSTCCLGFNIVDLVKFLWFFSMKEARLLKINSIFMSIKFYQRLFLNSRIKAWRWGGDILKHPIERFSVTSIVTNSSGSRNLCKSSKL